MVEQVAGDELVNEPPDRNITCWRATAQPKLTRSPTQLAPKVSAGTTDAACADHLQAHRDRTGHRDT
jgi:hypothetical protein